MRSSWWSLSVVAVMVGGCSGSKKAGSLPPGGDSNPPVECGNGVRVGIEQCDGQDLAGLSCVAAGYDGGDLACNADCTFSFTSCTGTAPSCGDEVAEGLEACDGVDLRDRDCRALGYDGGTLACAACAYETSGCTGTPAVCGDNNAEGLEECDGIDLGLRTCTSLGFDGGVLGCDATCRLVTGGCTGTAPVCGDGTAEGLEQCDGDDFNGIGCRTLGYDSGTIACDATCRFDVTACVGTPAVCGDDVIGGLEQCDGVDLAGAVCTDLNFAGGTLACDSSCTYDASGCTAPVCGNDVQEAGESCDGADLDNQDCADLGLGIGALSCNADCTFNTSACQQPRCGDGVVNQASEECDGTDNDGESCRSLTFVAGQLTCNADCTFNTMFCWGSTATCGDGTRDLSEDCEGTDLGGETCLSIGWDGGDLACTATCTFDTAACTGTAPACLDGVAEGDEMCDGTDLREMTCEDFGFTGGTLACSPQCTLSFVACTNTPVCGNDQAERPEVCDGSDLRGFTCESLNAGTGTLACLSTCAGFDFSGCSLAPVCGNDQTDLLEVCDGADLGLATDCTFFGYTGSEAVSCLPTCLAYDLSLCTGEGSRCGNDRRQGREQCDGPDLAGLSCELLGYASGTLACAANCSLDVSNCSL